MNGYFEKFFKKGQQLGRGSFGSVYKVEHCLAGIHLAEYAVKIVPVGNINWLNRALNEVKLLEQLSAYPHPFVLSYKHCWIEDWQNADFGPKVPSLFILMEYSQLGSLESYIYINKERGIEIRQLKNDEIWQIFLSIAIAIKHLHDCGILHRDLKLSNVLAFNDNHYQPLPMRFALCDFGTATSTFNGDIDAGEKRTGATGTIETMAPELLAQNESGEYKYVHTKFSDIWSLGVILFTLYTRKSPFIGENGEELLRNFTDVDSLADHLHIDVSRSSKEWEWIRKFMSAKPSKRTPLEDLFNDRFVREKTKIFGFEGLLDKPQFSHVVVTSPSIDDFNQSIPLPLALDINRNSSESSFLSRSASVETVEIPEKPQKVSENRIAIPNSFNTKIIDIAILFLACFSNISKYPIYEIVRVIFLLLIFWILSKNSQVALFIPLIVLIESLIGFIPFNVFLLLLILVQSLRIAQYYHK
ncbi:AGC family protein kinase [Trichomonas vaginalis G3]|uniref:AGC family protein kinase n=1 Tax=Trichomonas vaginalis (strain ATCC PRA-98 / G3) TaxID=412133 RepID=A2E933_TRIV3|nr:protein serine/threonine kinase protein [Trichomonas vaginalis G3]EAY10827.1 AGC family protein kinase [Trichomonas vaginalis G3]KAI5519915.1 protein serine/threonine kinase protein [Trichomonas vaginalis G3]|eukprot:XP_001323050.1 AGC family protein kinase [Trichomonas vaginalis G3]